MAVAQFLSKSKKGKAAGADGVSTAILKAAPRQLARLYHPTLCKAALQLQEPLSFKRGIGLAL
eukprot:9354082-Pyramimonas_sp.AAC.1